MSNLNIKLTSYGDDGYLVAVKLDSHEVIGKQYSNYQSALEAIAKYIGREIIRAARIGNTLNG